MHCVYYTVPAIYDVTIVFREGNPELLDIVNAKPSSADICVRSAKAMERGSEGVNPPFISNPVFYIHLYMYIV